MLYLVRKVNESIIINNDIEITIVEANSRSVKLGITYPKGASVLRKEVFVRISEENKKAIESVASQDILDAVTHDESK